MLEFSYRPQAVYGFHRGEGRSDRTLIEWDRDVDFFCVVKLRHSEQQSKGRMRNETKSISVRVTRFLVNSLFYT